MKKLIFLLIICSCSPLKTANLSNKNLINDNQNTSIDTENKKCINEFLLPCSSINKSENKIIIEYKIKNDANLVNNETMKIKSKNNKKTINKNVKKIKKSLSKNTNLSNKVVSIEDLPKSDLNKKISFDKYKSSMINYSIKSDYPDINK
tara:strand:- start:5 stop:451 length:447 start_codon:yes stop_codon:yes gene_type:complete